jgi:hypothetical protein
MADMLTYLTVHLSFFVYEEVEMYLRNRIDAVIEI